MADEGGKVVLVCGGREFRDKDFVFDRLDMLRRKHGVAKVVHGGATGADTLALMWSIARDIPSVAYRADWAKHGRKAGPLRNAEMLEEAKPDYGVAFPGGRGTADMVRRMKAANVPVWELS